jgi:hypothetical protein
MAHVHGMLDTKGYKHTFTICNTYCLSAATLGCTDVPQLYIKCTLHGLLQSTAQDI